MIETVVPRHSSQAARPLAVSHAEDPGMVGFFPDANRRPKAVRTLFEMTVRDAVDLGHVYAAVVDGLVMGTAVWLPPGGFPPGPGRMIASLPWQLRLAVHAPRSMPALARFGALSTRPARAERCWFLAGLGVDPRHQGTGLGSALLHAVLDQARGPCLLHTANPANVDYYHRFGFQVQGQPWRVGVLGPTFWTMRRPG